MSLFDEIKRQIQEAMEEAQAQAEGRPRQRRPQAQAPAPPPPQAPVPTQQQEQHSRTEAKMARRAKEAQQVTQHAAQQTARRAASELAYGRPALLRALQDRNGLRQAVLMAEILDRPKALRGPQRGR